MYDSLKAALLGMTSIPMAEYAWSTRPSGNYGVFQPDFEIPPDNGNDMHQDRGMEGSVDLYTRGPQPLIYAELEALLDIHCDGCWDVNSISLDTSTGLLHREYVFQMEAF